MSTVLNKKTVRRRFSVADRGRKPVPDIFNWLVNGKTSLA